MRYEVTGDPLYKVICFTQIVDNTGIYLSSLNDFFVWSLYWVMFSIVKVEAIFKPVTT